VLDGLHAALRHEIDRLGAGMISLICRCWARASAVAADFSRLWGTYPILRRPARKRPSFGGADPLPPLAAVRFDSPEIASAGIRRRRLAGAGHRRFVRADDRRRARRSGVAMRLSQYNATLRTVDLRNQAGSGASLDR